MVSVCEFRRRSSQGAFKGNITKELEKRAIKAKLKGCLESALRQNHQSSLYPDKLEHMLLVEETLKSFIRPNNDEVYHLLHLCSFVNCMWRMKAVGSVMHSKIIWTTKA